MQRDVKIEQTSDERKRRRVCKAFDDDDDDDDDDIDFPFDEQEEDEWEEDDIETLNPTLKDDNETYNNDDEDELFVSVGVVDVGIVDVVIVDVVVFVLFSVKDGDVDGGVVNVVKVGVVDVEVV